MIELNMELAGESIILHADRALWWPAGGALMVADVHLGKGNVLRNAGIALPTGQTITDLLRLDQLIERFRPQQLLVLGDLLHGPARTHAPWIGDVVAWRKKHHHINMLLIAGNHDRHFDARVLGFDVVDAPYRIPPFALCHAPCRIPGSFVLAGHVHPAVVLRDGWRRHRVPAFRFDRNTGVLPAFGALTGLHDEAPGDGEQVIAVTPGGLIPMRER